jgi:hypothetical protein
MKGSRQPRRAPKVIVACRRRIFAKIFPACRAILQNSGSITNRPFEVHRMSLTSVAMLFLQDTPPDANASGSNTVKLISGVLAVILVVIIIMRRKGKGSKKEEDEF